jgi:hypothetical protein
MTEFTVSVFRNPTEHRIRLNQVTKWAEHTVMDGPSGIAKRQRVRICFGGKNKPLPGSNRIFPCFSRCQTAACSVGNHPSYLNEARCYDCYH